MRFKWRYKICICSVILGEYESFRRLQGPQFSYIPKINLTYYESENVPDSSFHLLFESENLSFSFFYEK